MHDPGTWIPRGVQKVVLIFCKFFQHILILRQNNIYMEHLDNNYVYDNFYLLYTGKYLPSLMFARFTPMISGYRGNPGNSRTESYKEYNIRITSRFKHPLESSKEKVTKFRMKFVQI